MDSIGHIDYKKPVPPGYDMRTSTYMGHKYMDDTMLGMKSHPKMTETKKYQFDPLLERLRVSDYRSNYVWQFEDPDNTRTPTLAYTALYIKPYDELTLHFIKRPMKPLRSVYNEDFIRKSPLPCEEVHPKVFPPAIRNEKTVIDYSKPSCIKHLDPAATTNRLDYVSYHPRDLMKSVAAHDNITFWNWKEKKAHAVKVTSTRDEQICDETSAEKCPKRRCEYPSLVKSVPFSGLTTEVRDNYTKPKMEVPLPTIPCTVEKLHIPIEPSPKHTEGRIYGSGEPTHTYV